MNKKLNCILTGCSGLVGKAILETLIRNQVNVTGINRTADQLPFEYKHLSLDLSESGSLHQIDFRQAYTLVHAAALIPGPGNSFEKCQSVNALIDDNLCHILRNNSHVHIIFISTTNFYTFDQSYITETSETVATNAYALEKLNSERKFSSLGNPFTILRINAPYHYSMASKTVLKLFIENALQNKDILFHGSGSRSQDFTHVDDIAKAVLHSINLHHPNGIYNIASGFPICMKDLAELVVRSVPGCKSKIMASGLPDEQENHKALFDLKKAKHELSWVPSITIQQGIQEWVKKTAE